MVYKPVRSVHASDERGRLTLPKALCAAVEWLGEPRIEDAPRDVILTRIARVAIAVLPLDAPLDPYNLNARWTAENKKLRLQDRWSPRAQLARHHADTWPATLNPEKKQPRWRLQLPQELVDLGLAPAPLKRAVILAHSGWLEIWREEVWHTTMEEMDVPSVAAEAISERSLDNGEEDNEEN